MGIFQIDTAIWLALITTGGTIFTVYINAKQKSHETNVKALETRLDKSEARLDKSEEREEKLRDRISTLEGALASETAKNIRMSAHASAYIHKLREHINEQKPPPPPHPSTGVIQILGEAMPAGN